MTFSRKGPRAKDRSARQGLPAHHFFRPELEALEDRIAPTVNLLSHYTGLDFNTSLALSGGFTPPDTNGAAGTSNFVETVNQVVGIYSPKSTGTALVSDSLPTFFFTNGGLKRISATSLQVDPFTIYDPLVQRYIVGDCDTDVSTTNHLLLAVSKTSDPQTLTKADWNFYSLDTSEPGIVVQDFPGNPGYNADALVVTLNSFTSSSTIAHTLVTSISINALVSGTPLTLNTNAFESDFNGQSLRPTTMQDSVTGDPMWLLEQNPNGADNSINVVKMTNVLSKTPSFSTTTLRVNPYIDTANQPPLQPDGTPLTLLTDSSIQNASERNNTIVADQAVGNLNGTEDDVQWYAINVSSGSPVISQQGDVSAGNHTYLSYPAISINAAGDFGLTFMQSGTGPGQFMSMYVTGRNPTDNLGTMEAPVLVQQGQTNYHDFATSTLGRVGDLSGINVDANGTFWAVSEFANTEPTANWGTAIANFNITIPPVPPPPPPPPLPYIPFHLPMYAFDSVPLGSQFLPVQQALTTLLDAESGLIQSLVGGKQTLQTAAETFEGAFIQYFVLLDQYEKSLPNGG